MPKIDVHHHVFPPAMLQALEAYGRDPGGWFVPPWSIEEDKSLCGKLGIRTTILSVTSPGPLIMKDPAQAAQLARACNVYCAEVVAQHPASYGFFACMPDLHDVEASIAEIEYCFDELHADGVVLYTRYGKRPHYLGHQSFWPVWEELNRRKATVFIHPTPDPDDMKLINSYTPLPLVDYPHETGRAAVDLILSDTLNMVARDCKIILSHGGGSLPALIGRVAGLLPALVGRIPGLMPSRHMSVGKSGQEIWEEARTFYFDTATATDTPQLKALLSLAKPGHVLFGTDCPTAPSECVTMFDKKLEVSDDVPHEDIHWRSALALFPRIQQYYN